MGDKLIYDEASLQGKSSIRKKTMLMRIRSLSVHFFQHKVLASSLLVGPLRLEDAQLQGRAMQKIL